MNARSLVIVLIIATTQAYAHPQSVKFMQFNVENLFDITHDEGKSDYTFLPLNEKKKPEVEAYCRGIPVKKWREQCFTWDWSKKTLRKKLERLKNVVKLVNKGKGPDFLFLEEVENKAVLETWRKKYLNGMGYQESILLEGPDTRGIDVALLSKFKPTSTPVLHEIPFTNISPDKKRDTRGILEATFELPDKTPITLFVVHFPAPFHPKELRQEALNFLLELRNKLPSDRLVIAGGDFNITSDEGVKNGALEQFVKPHWIMAHEFCKDCQGTTYHTPSKSWSFLDMILLSPNFEKSTWKLQPDSVKVINSAPGQTNKFGHPEPFDLPDATGVSDHWPLLLELRKF